MVYSNRFVVCILVNGEVQRELANGEVHIPFGTHYTIRLRNKHYRRAVGQIFIDGENVSEVRDARTICPGGYVISPHSYVDIHRYSNADRAFKFVDLNSPEAVDAGKNGPTEDGCTVEGTSTGQRFSYTRMDLEDSYTSCKVFLKGYKELKAQTQRETYTVEVKFYLEKEPQVRRVIHKWVNEPMGLPYATYSSSSHRSTTKTCNIEGTIDFCSCLDSGDCTECGHRYAKGDKFCAVCGKKIG